jgi:hypothetical protein
MVAFLVGSAVLLAGCGKKSPAKVVTDGSADGADSVTAALTGERSVKVTTQEGTATITTSSRLPAGFPLDVPVYRGASVVNSVQGEDALGVTLQTTDSVQAIADFYKRAMAGAGWKQEANVNIQGNTMMSYVKGDRTLNVIINDAGEARVITLGLTSTRDSSK